MNFHETKMGREFFGQQLPQLIGTLQKIAEAQTQPTPVLRLPDSWIDGDLLAELFGGTYRPESLAWKADGPLNRSAIDAEKALSSALSPQQRELLDAYEAAENRHNYDVCLQAFRDGARLAVQVILAGCAPDKGKDAA